MIELTLETSKESNKEKTQNFDLKNKLLQKDNLTSNKEQNIIEEKTPLTQITENEDEKKENQETDFLNKKLKNPKRKIRKFINILKQIDLDISKLYPEEINKKKKKEENQKIQIEKFENEKDEKENKEESTNIKCTICLENINNPAKLDTCGHEFCTNCIKHWSTLSSECPLCKLNFHNIIFYDEKNMKKEKKVKRKKFKPEKEVIEQWYNNCDEKCLICNKKNNTSYLLICDKCNFRVCHTFCVGLDYIPDGEFICPECKINAGIDKENAFNYYKEYKNEICKIRQSDIKINENEGNDIKKKNILNKKNKIKRKRNKVYACFNGYYLRQHPKIYTLRKNKNKK